MYFSYVYHMPLEAAEISALHHRNKLHAKIYWNINRFFYIELMFHNITDVLYF